MSEQWLEREAAASLIVAHVKCSLGRALAVLAESLSSGEVRRQPGFVTATDEGLPDFSPRGSIEAADATVSEVDLLDWLSRHHPQEPTSKASVRFPGDAALIEEGKRLVAGGMQMRAVARQLAERAEGAGTIESKVDRLRKLLASAGNPKNSQ